MERTVKRIEFRCAADCNIGIGLRRKREADILGSVKLYSTIFKTALGV